MANARAKSEQADLAADQARRDSDQARIRGKEFAPEFHQPGTVNILTPVRVTLPFVSPDNLVVVLFSTIRTRKLNFQLS